MTELLKETYEETPRIFVGFDDCDKSMYERFASTYPIPVGVDENCMDVVKETLLFYNIDSIEDVAKLLRTPCIPSYGVILDWDDDFTSNTDDDVIDFSQFE